jgi:DNA polymerase-3 subunit alpha
MTALLSVTKNETEKMALYINDARNMGVKVLAPDVNASFWDFAIEESEGKPAIRFGLGAIKNVGQGAVELIVKSRGKDGAFKDLNELAARVDLRAVGKRALDSLIKVGAMDKFGSRTAMLEALERIVAVSSSHFRAAEAGQLSLFGGSSGVTDSINLPLVPEADRRETLGWERELIGMYMSEHPLIPYMTEIRKVVTHFSATLGEAAHEDKTRVAGMVSNIRPYQTKTGKMMAWVILEDLSGTIELVLFPRTWEKYQFALEVGKVIIAEGKVDANSNPSKVLVDNITTEIKLTEPLQLVLKPQHTPAERKPEGQPTKHVAEPAAGYKKSPVSRARPESMLEPPPPDDPPDWEDLPKGGPSFSMRDVTGKEPEMPTEEPAADPAIDPYPSPGAEEVEVSSAAPELPSIPATILMASVIPPGLKIDMDQAPQMLTVTLRPTGDGNRDIRRISRLYGTLISYPGKDRFAFQIFEDGHGHLIEFPNDTTRLCSEMLAKIREAVGEENMRVEPIMYQ